MNIKLIAHRGNTMSSCMDLDNLENNPIQIDRALYLGYDAEVDIYTYNNNIYLGHDSPKYKISFEWLHNRREKLWIHCKTIESLLYMRMTDNILMLKGEQPLHYFFHQNDDVVLTSKGFLWHFPGKGSLGIHSVGCLPELHNSWDLNSCYGVCSDHIERYK